MDATRIDERLQLLMKLKDMLAEDLISFQLYRQLRAKIIQELVDEITEV